MNPYIRRSSLEGIFQKILRLLSAPFSAENIAYVPAYDWDNLAYILLQNL